jgi:methyl-accepting chemotaxis protein
MEMIHLTGAEDVARAGSTIASAADRMSQAAGTIDDTLTRFTRNMEEMVSRAEAAAQSFERLADSIDDLRNEMIAQANQAPDEVDDTEMAQRQPCPGCIDCGPPIVVKAEDRCGKGS